MADFSAPQVLVRRAIARDKADVLEFTRLIWEGHDYIPDVWDDWYLDPHGILAVAEYAGHAVGMGKVSRLSQGQWWLEGLRVDPKYQGLKISSHIHEYLEDWWKEYAGGTIRLMTSSERVQVQHLCERFGWQKVGEVKTYAAPALSDECRALRPARDDEIDAALSFAAAHLGYAYGLADLCWQSAAPDAELLRQQAAGSRLLWWFGGQASGQEPAGLVGCWEDEQDGERVLGIAFMAAQVGSLAEMLMDVRRLAGQRDYDSVLWLAPDIEDVQVALQAAGLESRWDGSAYLYAKSGADNRG